MGSRELGETVGSPPVAYHKQLGQHMNMSAVEDDTVHTVHTADYARDYLKWSTQISNTRLRTNNYAPQIDFKKKISIHKSQKKITS